MPIVCRSNLERVSGKQNHANYNSNKIDNCQGNRDDHFDHLTANASTKAEANSVEQKQPADNHCYKVILKESDELVFEFFNLVCNLRVGGGVLVGCDKVLCVCFHGFFLPF